MTAFFERCAHGNTHWCADCGLRPLRADGTEIHPGTYGSEVWASTCRVAGVDQAPDVLVEQIIRDIDETVGRITAAHRGPVRSMLPQYQGTFPPLFGLNRDIAPARLAPGHVSEGFGDQDHYLEELQPLLARALFTRDHHAEATRIAEGPGPRVLVVLDTMWERTKLADRKRCEDEAEIIVSLMKAVRP